MRRTPSSTSTDAPNDGVRRGRVVAAACVLVFAAGCAGDGPGVSVGSTTTVPGATTTTLAGSGARIEDIQADVFAPTCATSGCHDDVTRAGTLRLTTAETSYDDLVGVPSTCAARIRVVPGDTAASYLLHKLGAGPAPCGALMPIGAPALSGAELQEISDWIAAGAAPPGAAIVFASESGASSTTSTTGGPATTTTTIENE